MTNDSELERLLQDRFAISTTQFKAVLRLFPASRPWAASLIEDEGCVLDDADFGSALPMAAMIMLALTAGTIWSSGDTSTKAGALMRGSKSLVTLIKP